MTNKNTKLTVDVSVRKTLSINLDKQYTQTELNEVLDQIEKSGEKDFSTYLLLLENNGIGIKKAPEITELLNKPDYMRITCDDILNDKPEEPKKKKIRTR